VKVVMGQIVRWPAGRPRLTRSAAAWIVSLSLKREQERMFGTAAQMG